jgi:sec-independent protein translocase protein TatA
MFEGLFQPMHLLVIFGLALLVFGPKKLPELGKGTRRGDSWLQGSHARR